MEHERRSEFGSRLDSRLISNRWRDFLHAGKTSGRSAGSLRSSVPGSNPGPGGLVSPKSLGLSDLRLEPKVSTIMVVGSKEPSAADGVSQEKHSAPCAWVREDRSQKFSVEA